MTVNKIEQIKPELMCRLEEYKALRSEIASTLTSAYQTTNLTLIAIGALITVIKFDTLNKYPEILIAASFVFHALLWIQLRYEEAVFNMSEHIINNVALEVRKLLSEISLKENIETVLSWESLGRSRNHSNKVVFYPIEGARFIFPFIFALTSFLFYGYITLDQNLLYCKADGLFCSIRFLILLVNLSLNIYSFYMIIQVRRMLKGQEESTAEKTIVRQQSVG